MTRTEALRWRERIENAAKHLPDEDALESVELFPTWEPDIVYSEGDRRRYGGTLYKCRQQHTSQNEWEPDKTPALWAVISVADGTREHPIPYSAGMELTEGLFYAEDGVLYEATRSTGVPVYNALKDLVGVYVRKV